jgi:tRNA-specific 2-thiouridylase
VKRAEALQAPATASRGGGPAQPRVLAAMSGGVDSAVAAALLAERGHEVTGVTLKLWCYGKTPLSPRACCTLDAIDDARRVARRMGFPHYVVEAEEVFRARVLQPFLDAYTGGRTPYPCALCNQHLKFGDLMSRAEEAGADRLATGHYARVARLADGSVALLRAVDDAKDQSYALALVPYGALGRVIFPLGDFTKDEVRAEGRRLGLSVWEKPESQDLCFVPDGDYAGFITKSLGETRGTTSGPFLDRAGRRLGTHRGIIHYTVGQRRGLSLAGGERLYVLAIDAGRNAVVVGPKSALECAGLATGPVNWLAPRPPEAGARLDVKIRYHHHPAAARVHPRPDGSAEVRFEAAQPAVTPGQLCAFYLGERCLGGGTIEHALAADGTPLGHVHGEAPARSEAAGLVSIALS